MIKTLKSGVSYGCAKSPGPTSGLRTLTPSASRILAKLSNSHAANNRVQKKGIDESSTML